jgi:hypothetical protein
MRDPPTLLDKVQALEGRLLRFHYLLRLSERKTGMAADRFCGACRRKAKTPQIVVGYERGRITGGSK